ncbi:hypothetical protein EVAR_103038_1 [Eumeta japonica]|uniref:Uncharacterized protein n=1 Tax=Eumeta variegata TaxID=151549 RepID=A0A4C1WC94_EUMVA|nr:hypothetical protein EVAR_103038_1 [Eumeta japonica]
MVESEQFDPSSDRKLAVLLRDAHGGGEYARTVSNGREKKRGRTESVRSRKARRPKSSRTRAREARRRERPLSSDRLDTDLTLRAELHPAVITLWQSPPSETTNQTMTDAPISLQFVDGTSACTYELHTF